MNKGNSFSSKGFAVWGVCALFFLYEFSLRTVTGTFQHPIMYDLNLTTFKFSLVSSTTYLIIYGFMQLPVGLIVDRIGLKKSLLIGCVTCTIAGIGFSFANDFYLAVVWRMLMGFGSSFGFICLIVSVYEWMPHRHSALFIGLSQFIGTLGPMLAAGPLNSIAEQGKISWRLVFMNISLLGIAITFLIAFFVKNNHEKTGGYIILKRPQPISESLKKVFTRWQPWAIAIFSACGYFTLEYLSENEGKELIMLKGFSSNLASYAITISWLGFALSCPLIGFFSDYLKRRKALMIMTSICYVSAIITIFLATNKEIIMFSFFLLGVSASGQSIGFATISEQLQKKYIAIGLSFNNAVITTLAAINAPAIGLLLDSQKVVGSHPSINDYNSLFVILISLSIITLIFALFFIKETFCKSKVEFTFLKPMAS